MRTLSAVLLALALPSLALALPTLTASHAYAHGREPSLNQVAFDPSDPDHLVVRATWALMTSRDHGETWTWTCAAAVGFDRTIEDPAVVITEGGPLCAGTFDGLAQSDAAGCSWSYPSPLLTDIYTIDVQPDPSDGHVVWAANSPGDRANTVLRSSDDGATWELMGSPDDVEPFALLERIRLAASDPMRVYASGAVPGPPRQAFFFRSEDGGRTWASTEIPLLDAERNIHVLAVDPTNADRVFARMVRRVTDEVPERLLRSEDGGRTWETATELLEITGVAVSDDGMHVWAGSWDGGFARSDDGGRTFDMIDPELRVRCLAYRPGELWVCVDDLVDDYALGVSSDLGATITPVWTFRDVENELGCPGESPVGMICPDYWTDVIIDLGIIPNPDGGLADGSVGMDGGVRDGGGGGGGGGGCSCRVGGERSARAPMLLALLGLAIVLRRRCSH